MQSRFIYNEIQEKKVCYRKKSTSFIVYSESSEALRDALRFSLGEDIFEVVRTPFQQLFKMPETELLQYLIGPLEQLMNRSLGDLFRVQSWFNRALLTERDIGGAGKEAAASPLPPFFSWLHFTVMPQ